MSMIQALGNVSKVRGALIFVEDAEAELKFYRDVIGLRLLYRTRTFIRFDATQGTSLSLISGGTASAEPKDYRRGGVVPELIVDNLALAIRRLDSAGVRHEEVVRRLRIEKDRPALTGVRVHCLFRLDRRRERRTAVR